MGLGLGLGSKLGGTLSWRASAFAVRSASFAAQFTSAMLRTWLGARVRVRGRGRGRGRGTGRDRVRVS